MRNASFGYLPQQRNVKYGQIIGSIEITLAPGNGGVQIDLIRVSDGGAPE